MVNTQSSSTSQKLAILVRMALSISWSLRKTMMSGLDAEAAELLDGVLRGLGLDLVGGGDVGNEAHVDVADVLGPTSLRY